MKSIIIFTAAIILPFSSHANVSNGACARIHEPVFCTSTLTSKDRNMFSNLCLAEAAGFNSANCGPEVSVDPIDLDLSVNPIDPDVRVNPIDPDFAVDPIDPDFSVCAMIYEPVVCTATPNSRDYNKFSNICEAEKAGFDSNNCTLKTGGLRGLKPSI